MSVDGEDSRWMCGRSGVVNLQRVSSIVREIREPCRHHSPSKGSKMLKPEKWQTIFDRDGKILGFQKVLKLIILGGVDPSIRAEVWEFLLGCYALSSTAEYRKQLRVARRERYEDLVRQCQTMHSSIGTGSLAYVVGSKVMDMRTLSKDNDSRVVSKRKEDSHSPANEERNYDSENRHTGTPYMHIRKCSSSVGARVSVDTAACDSSHVVPSLETYTCSSTPPEHEMDEPQYVTESFFDFPPLPVTNLFHNGGGDTHQLHDDRVSVSKHRSSCRVEEMHCFQINNNVDLIIESNAPSSSLSNASNGDTEIFSSDVPKHVIGLDEMKYNTETINGLRILDVPETAMMDASATTSNRQIADEDKVSEWLWTLHRIVVDVVRTDSHLEFYGDAKNMARMSDILAVYAWVDPATGYCQGMSDLLSPFVVLYEDNADAFWCFEMLLRRMRENFQMEGPTGVMNQLQGLWKILEITDSEIFEHLSVIGAESLHFAFRMLLVLFRRELSFTEALHMWEMMWAADFDEAVAQQLEENCLEPLVLQLQQSPDAEIKAENRGNGIYRGKLKSPNPQHTNGEPSSPYGDRIISSHPFCGLTKANFWARHEEMQVCTTATSERNGDDELPVFCVAAILLINRQKIMRQTHSIEDVIKMFNDNKLKINVKGCIRMAIKLRKKYYYKLNKNTSMGSSEPS
ncbi:small G protein signaling modulator 1-like isoform X3 [Iris pallida]|uniref:Small G protein signaling modulator 1-like isoform X3 n=1 Tax=Iris pallida TaxID=29817 RepID=A0AAX6HMA0_IRIPA|nr:small G protein signaling modulator 1-like isoform X3 [Iris pallida]